LTGLSSLVKSGDIPVVPATSTSTSTSPEESRDGYAQSRTDEPESTEPVTGADSTNAQGTTTIVLSQDTTALAEVVAEKCLPSVVAIDIYTYQAGPGYGSRSGGYYGYLFGEEGSGDSQLELYSLGSGVVLTADGYVLTNYHVIEGFDAIRVTAEGQEYEAILVGSDPSSDLAVIKLDIMPGDKLTPIAIGDSDTLKAGQWVMTIGSPFGYEQSVATGIVSALGRSTVMTSESDANALQLYVNLIQTDAAINPGNSGGAMVNAEGELVGINTLITSYSGNYSGVGFAIPVNYALAIANQIISGQQPTHASLGVSIITLTASNASRYHTAVTKGVYVSRVYAGTGADAAGMQEGDVIVALDGKAMVSGTDLMLAVRSHNPGDSVTVTINRDGTEMTLTATLGSD
ncbi:MAG: trypsin-like peptidase domain-containing protein, partial [Eggerthellaceae bacterium]|nr:trypsin-like peptidase domain-containing protein [Eggerthellaceae bacterium]